MYFEIIFCFVLAFIIIYTLKEIYNYWISSKDKCLKEVYFIARLEGDCGNVENIIRSLEICADKFGGSRNDPSIIIITDNAGEETIKACRVFVKDYPNIKLLKGNELIKKLSLNMVN